MIERPELVTNTQVQRFFAWIHNHRVTSALIIVGVVVIAFGQFVSSVEQIRTSVGHWFRGFTHHYTHKPRNELTWEAGSLVNGTEGAVSYEIWDYNISMWAVSTILPGETHFFKRQGGYAFLRFEDATENYYRLGSRAFDKFPTEEQSKSVEPNYIRSTHPTEGTIWWHIYFSGKEIGPLAPVIRDGDSVHDFAYP
jgi:hypothetical protein